MPSENDFTQDHCPQCGRFVGVDPDGFYESLPGDDDNYPIYVYCNEACADKHHGRVAVHCTEGGAA